MTVRRCSKYAHCYQLIHHNYMLSFVHTYCMYTIPSSAYVYQLCTFPPRLLRILYVCRITITYCHMYRLRTLFTVLCCIRAYVWKE
jgi:hypothetical protein